MKELDSFSGIKERFMALLLSESNHDLAIAEDPPDAGFKTLTAVEPPAFPVGRNDSALVNATAGALAPLDRRRRSPRRWCTRSSATRAHRPPATASGRSAAA